MFSAIGSPYTFSHLVSTDSFSLFRTVFEIFEFEVFGVWLWPLTFLGQLRSKIFSPFDSSSTTPSQTSLEAFSLSLAVFEIFDFKIFEVWPWPSTFSGYLRSNVFSALESSYMTSFLTSIGTSPLSPTVFKIFDFKVYRVWFDLWTLGVSWGEKWFHYTKAHTWLPFLLLLKLFLFFVPFLRYSTSKFRCLTLTSDLWCAHEFSNILTTWRFIHDSLFNSCWHFLSISCRIRCNRLQNFCGSILTFTFAGFLRLNVVPAFESTYVVPYLTSSDTSSLSCTVFDKFGFKNFGVWPWTLIFNICMSSVTFSPFNCSYMIFYLTPIDTFSLSPTVFEIFDFEVFGVWPWPLTFAGHLRWNMLPEFKNTNVTSYITIIDTFSS